MTATYDLSTDVGKVRLAIQDTDTSDAEFTDEEIEVFVDTGGSWQQGALLAVDSLIAKYAKKVNFALGPRREDLGQIVEHYKLLREHLASGLGGAILTEDLTFSWIEEDADTGSTEWSEDD